MKKWYSICETASPFHRFCCWSDWLEAQFQKSTRKFLIIAVDFWTLSCEKETKIQVDIQVNSSSWKKKSSFSHLAWISSDYFESLLLSQ